MSVVACKVYNDRYEIASDSIIVFGYSQIKGKNMDLVKLIEGNGVIIGYSGISAELEMMRIFLKNHHPKEESTEAILDFVEEFVQFMKKKTDSEYRKFYGVMLIGLDNKVFYFNDWCATIVTEYCAIGAGMDYANTALYLDHTVEKAVEVATELSIYCEKPIVKKVRKFK